MGARWLAVALVPLGTVTGHVLGYLLAGEDAALSGPHGHLRPVLWPALAAAVAALVIGGALADDDPRRRGLRTSRLVVAQMALFGVAEALEHLHAGHHGLSFAVEASFLWGMGAQVASAALLVVLALLAHLSGRLAREHLPPRPVPLPPASHRRWRHLDRVIPKIGTASSVSERGPPGSPASV